MILQVAPTLSHHLWPRNDRAGEVMEVMTGEKMVSKMDSGCVFGSTNVFKAWKYILQGINISPW